MCVTLPSSDRCLRCRTGALSAALATPLGTLAAVGRLDLVHFLDAVHDLDLGAGRRHSRRSTLRHRRYARPAVWLRAPIAWAGSELSLSGRSDIVRIMMNPNDLRQHLRLRTLDENDDANMALSAFGAVSAVIGDDAIEGHASWYDDMMTDGGKATGLHIRVVVAGGVITLDHDFSMDAYPDAKFVPWSRIRSLSVIAEPRRQTVVANAWLEAEEGIIEFAGAFKDELPSLLRATRRHLL